MSPPDGGGGGGDDDFDDFAAFESAPPHNAAPVDDEFTGFEGEGNTEAAAADDDFAFDAFQSAPTGDVPVFEASFSPEAAPVAAPEEPSAIDLPAATQSGDNEFEAFGSASAPGQGDESNFGGFEDHAAVQTPSLEGGFDAFGSANTPATAALETQREEFAAFGSADTPAAAAGQAGGEEFDAFGSAEASGPAGVGGGDEDEFDGFGGAEPASSGPVETGEFEAFGSASAEASAVESGDGAVGGMGDDEFEAFGDASPAVAVESAGGAEGVDGGDGDEEFSAFGGGAGEDASVGVAAEEKGTEADGIGGIDAQDQGADEGGEGGWADDSGAIESVNEAMLKEESQKADVAPAATSLDNSDVDLSSHDPPMESGPTLSTSSVNRQQDGSLSGGDDKSEIAESDSVSHSGRRDPDPHATAEDDFGSFEVNAISRFGGLKQHSDRHSDHGGSLQVTFDGRAIASAHNSDAGSCRSEFSGYSGPTISGSTLRMYNVSDTISETTRGTNSAISGGEGKDFADFAESVVSNASEERSIKGSSHGPASVVSAPDSGFGELDGTGEKEEAGEGEVATSDPDASKATNSMDRSVKFNIGVDADPSPVPVAEDDEEMASPTKPMVFGFAELDLKEAPGDFPATPGTPGDDEIARLGPKEEDSLGDSVGMDDDGGDDEDEFLDHPDKFAPRVAFDDDADKAKDLEGLSSGAAAVEHDELEFGALTPKTPVGMVDEGEAPIEVSVGALQSQTENSALSFEFPDGSSPKPVVADAQEDTPIDSTNSDNFGGGFAAFGSADTPATAAGQAGGEEFDAFGSAEESGPAGVGGGDEDEFDGFGGAEPASSGPVETGEFEAFGSASAEASAVESGDGAVGGMGDDEFEAFGDASPAVAVESAGGAEGVDGGDGDEEFSAFGGGAGEDASVGVTAEEKGTEADGIGGIDAQDQGADEGGEGGWADDSGAFESFDESRQDDGALPVTSVKSDEAEDVMPEKLPASKADEDFGDDFDAFGSADTPATAAGQAGGEEFDAFGSAEASGPAGVGGGDEDEFDGFGGAEPASSGPVETGEFEAFGSASAEASAVESGDGAVGGMGDDEFEAFGDASPAVAVESAGGAEGVDGGDGDEEFSAFGGGAGEDASVGVTAEEKGTEADGVGDDGFDAFESAAQPESSSADADDFGDFGDNDFVAAPAGDDAQAAGQDDDFGDFGDFDAFGDAPAAEEPSFQEGGGWAADDDAWGGDDAFESAPAPAEPAAPVAASAAGTMDPALSGLMDGGAEEVRARADGLLSAALAKVPVDDSYESVAAPQPNDLHDLIKASQTISQGQICRKCASPMRLHATLCLVCGQKAVRVDARKGARWGGSTVESAFLDGLNLPVVAAEDEADDEGVGQEEQYMEEATSPLEQMAPGLKQQETQQQPATQAQLPPQPQPQQDDTFPQFQASSKQEDDWSTLDQPRAQQVQSPPRSSALARPASGSEVDSLDVSIFDQARPRALEGTASATSGASMDLLDQTLMGLGIASVTHQAAGGDSTQDAVAGAQKPYDLFGGFMVEQPLSAEAQQFIAQLPDLSFMLSEMLSLPTMVLPSAGTPVTPDFGDEFGGENGLSMSGTDHAAETPDVQFPSSEAGMDIMAN